MFLSSQRERERREREEGEEREGAKEKGEREQIINMAWTVYYYTIMLIVVLMNF